ncbi:MAG: hypothetical protein SGJ11_10550 [Phycisphaerae bacterium]|nr:hypothetical protein [Phycisphaerae bacterium]
MNTRIPLHRFVAPLACLCCAGIASADNVYQPLPFSQDWSDVNLITTNDDWAGVPGILGFLGQNITTTTGTDPQTLLTVSGAANDIDVIANQTAPNSTTSGGVGEFEITDPVVALQGSGTADAPHLLFHIDATGQSAIQVAYNLRDIDGSADNSIQQVALQYRIGERGDFTNVPSAYVADASSGPDLATLVTAVNVTLPAECDNQPQLQIRVISANAVGSDEWIGVDDIVITGNGGGETTFACSVADPSQSLRVGGSATVGYTLVENPGAIPVANTDVTFLITSGPNAGTTETLSTDESGFVEFTYSSNGVTGTDDIDLTAATRPDGTVCTASVTWTGATTEVPVVINETDADQIGTDSSEFIELYDGGVGNTPLDGLVIVLWNGSNDSAYNAFDLDGKSTNANGYFVLGNAAVTTALLDAGFVEAELLTFNNDSLQNGQDGVGLYTGDASSFPNGTPVTADGIRDAVVYDTNDADDAGLAILVNRGQPQIDENGGGSGVLHSIQRCPNGSGGLRNTMTFTASAPTPGAANAYTNVPADVTATPDDVCAGEAVTLSGSVGSDETIEWHEGSANGAVVGTGSSIVVNPRVSTTYFAVSTQVVSMCVSVNFASVVVAVSDCDCVGDIDGNSQVDGADLAILLGNWGGAGDGDFDSSGEVDGADLAILLGAWGPCAG